MTLGLHDPHDRRRRQFRRTVVRWLFGIAEEVKITLASLALPARYSVKRSTLPT